MTDDSSGAPSSAAPATPAAPATLASTDAGSQRSPAQRAATVLGWFSGASLGLMLSIGVGAWLGPAYPMVIGNFGGVVLGAFGGMGLADRWGARSLKPLAFVTGVLMLIALMLVLTVIGAPGAER